MSFTRESPMSVAITVLEGVGALLRLELLGVRDDCLVRDIPQESFVFALQVESWSVLSSCYTHQVALIYRPFLHQVALIYRTLQTTTTDRLTRLLVRSNRLVLGMPQWASRRVSGHPHPGPWTGSWRRGWGGRRRRCPHPRLPRSGAGFPWSSCWAPATACRWGLRRGKGRRTGGRWRGKRRKSSRRENNHMDDHGDGVKVRTRLELELMWVWWKCARNRTTCARSVVQCYASGEMHCGIVVSVVISICVIELSVLVLLVLIL